MSTDEPRKAGEILRRQAIADAKTLGRGAVTAANRKRAEWRLTTGGRFFPSSVSVPTVRDLAAFVAALGLDVPRWCERVGRYASGPVSELMELVDSVRERRPKDNKQPEYLGAARARTWLPHVDLGEGVLEALEEMRFDDPRTALKASRDALKEAAGPVSVGRVLAVHASNLREVDELAEAFLALRVAIPALDVVGDLQGIGRALSVAGAVARACGEFGLAGGLNDYAEMMHIRGNSLAGRGSAMGLRGALILAAGGDPGIALRELDAALPLLLADGVRWRVVGVQQVRSAALVECGDIVGARAAISAAIAAAPDAAMLRGRLAWRAADIETAAGDHPAAELLYRQAFGLVADPLCDRLLIAAQAVRAATCQGKTTQAFTLAKVLLEPLFEILDDTNPTRRVLRAAHADLYRAALEAGLTAAVVDQAISRIEAARTARRRRLRRQVIIS